ncbi:MAG TPA: thioesterase family protein [Actinomycetes bacterium]|nr:thioesterase family protein [Actinomycetes bacterium]
MGLDGLLVGEGTVLAEHIDYNGHMNVVHYRAAFDVSTDGLFAHLGLGPEDYTARTGATLMVVEEHTRYHAELAEGERYRILARLVGHSARKLHYLLAMENTGRGILAATHEELALHVDLTARRSTPLPAAALAAVEALEAEHALLPSPPDLGRVISPRGPGPGAGR